MKKSLLVTASIIVVVLAVAMVSAGWFTGNAIWAWNWCSSSNQCPAGEGDCDKDSDCLTGYCAQNVGLKYGQRWYMDVCECPAGSTLDAGSNSCVAPNSTSSDTISHLEIEGDGLLDPSIDFNNKQFGGGAIRFKEKGDTKAGISGGSFGFSDSFLILDANKIRLEKLTGSGNAYACIDSKGNLFRSDSPCR